MQNEELTEDEILYKNALEKAECESSYFEFFKSAWQVLEPKTKLKINWHIEYLCDILEDEVHRVGKGVPKTQDLIINIPPRSAKSYIVSVMLGPWAWIHYPHLRFINASHSSPLSTKHCVQSRMLIQSDWYQKHWGQVFNLVDDQNQKTNFRNNHQGERLATSVGAAILGAGADIIISDDLLDPAQAASDAERERANNFYDHSLYSRLNDAEVGLRIIVMQRLHDDDTTGHALNLDEIQDNDFPDDSILSEHRHISIPAETTGYISPPELIEKYDENGLFFPERFTRNILDKAKKRGALVYACQFLQKVAPPEGHIFKRQWFNFTDKIPDDWEFDFMTQSWDCTFKDLDTSDYVVGQVWGCKNGKHYLVRQVRDKMDITKTMEMIKKFTVWHPKATRKIIEDKANGTAIISMLKSQIPGIIPFPGKDSNVSPNDSKPAKYQAASPIVESGAVWLLNPEKHIWVEEFLDEVTKVPNADNDDQADSMTMYLLSIERDSLAELRNFVKSF